MRSAGTWWRDINIELTQLDNGKVYALNGWNGETFLHCWECTGDHFLNASDDEYELAPVYRFQVEDVDISTVAENSEEWEKMTEIVDYEIR